MRAPDEDTLEALRSLYGHPQFRLIRSWLADAEEDETKRAIYDPPEQARESRGRAQLLRDLRDIIETAPDKMGQLERRREHKAPRR